MLQWLENLDIVLVGMYTMSGIDPWGVAPCSAGMKTMPRSSM